MIVNILLKMLKKNIRMKVMLKFITLIKFYKYQIQKKKIVTNLYNV